MKDFFFGILALAFLAGCDGSSSGGLPPVTPGAVGGADIEYVGGFTGPYLPADGTCEVPAVALEGFATASGLGSFTPPKVLKYVVATSNVLWCGATLPDGSFRNIDFSQSPFKGLTCQELAADTPDAVSALSSGGDGWGFPSGPCCVMNVPAAGGYVQSTGLVCDGYAVRPDVVASLKVMCSISGVFMGWACGQ